MIQRLPLLLAFFVIGPFFLWSQAQSSVFLPPQTQNPICNGDRNGRIIFEIQGDSTDFFFSWSGGNLPTFGNPTFGNGVRRQVGLGAATYSVFILDLSSGFDTTVEVTLTNPPPISVNGGGVASACQGLPLQLSATTNAAPGSVIVWSYTNANGPQSITGQTVNIPPPPSPLAITGPTTINVRLTDPNGCVANDQVQATINPNPSGTANPATQSICSGPVSINMTSNLAGTTYIWSVSQSGVTGATGGSGLSIQQNLRATGSNNGMATYTIRPISAQGCFGSPFTSTVTVKPKPTVTAVPDSSEICSGQTTSIALSSNVNNATFAWRAGATNASGAVNGSGNTISQVLTTNASGGKAGYRVAATANDCVSDSIRVVVMVKPIPVITVSPADTINVCSGQTGTFTYGVSPSAALISWTALPNLVGATSGTGTNNSQLYTNNSNQTLRATFQVSAALNGCTAISRQTRVRVRPLPIVSFSAPKDTICSGESTNLQLNSSLTNSTFSWTSAATNATGNQASGTSNPINHVLQTASGFNTGSVVYKVRASKDGCQGPEASKEIVVNNPVIPFSATAASSGICSGSEASITMTSSLPGISYSWTVNASNVSGASAGSGALITQTLTLTGSGSGFVDYTITPRSGACQGTPQVVRIQVNPNPTVPTISLNGGNSPICPGQSLTLTSSQLFGNQWIRNGLLIPAPTGTQQSLVVSDSGHYQVRFTNSNGCSSISAITAIELFESPNPAVISGPAGFCPGNTARLRSSAASGNQWLLNGVEISGANDSILLANTAGIYTVRLQSANCQVVSNGFELNLFSLPPAPVISGTNLLCTGDSIVLSTSAATTWQWLRNGTAIAGATGQTLVIYQSGNYQVQIGNENGCNSTSPVFNVQSAPKPPIPPITGIASICPGDSTLLSTNNTNPAWAIQWFLNGTPIAGGTERTQTAKEAGTYTLTLTTAQGCTSLSAPFEVSLRESPPQPTISGLPLICPGGSTVLNSTAATGNLWSLNGNPISGANNATYVANEAGTYTVKVTGANGCSSSSEPFQLNPTSTISTEATLTNPSACGLSDGSIEIISTGGSGSYVYTWIPLLPGMIQGASQQDNLPAGVYQAYIFDAQSGCTQVISGMVLNDPGSFVVNAQITPVSTCNGSNGQIALDITGAAGPFTFVWTGPISGTTQTLSNAPAGIYSVQVTENSTGCTSFLDSLEISSPLPPKPMLTASGSLEFCTGDSIILSTSSGEPIQWFRNNILLAGQTSASLKVTTSGNYFVRVGSAGCFSRSDTVTVTVNPLPASPFIALSGSSNVCEGVTVGLNINSTLAIQWTRNGENLAGANGSFLEVSQSGTYCVKVTDANGCSRVSNTCREINVEPLPPKPVLSGPAGFCPGEQVTLTHSPFDTTQYTYTWLRNSGFLANSNLESLTTSLAGWYMVRAVDRFTGCRIFSDSIFVEAFPTPNLPVIQGGSQLCTGSVLNLSTDEANSYQWIRNGIEVDGATNQTFNIQQGGNYQVRTINLNGCASTSAVFSVGEISPPPASSISGISSFCNGASVILTASPNLNYQWLLNGQILPGETNQTLIANQFGAYQVLVQSGPACADTSAIFETTASAANFTLEITAESPFCEEGNPANNGRIEVTAIGGSGTYNYVWNAGLTPGAIQENLAAGAYVATVTDLATSCQLTTDTIRLVAPPTLSLESLVSNDKRCDLDNGFIKVSAQNGSGNYQYSWPALSVEGDSIGGLAAGVYTVEVRDLTSGCLQRFENLIVSGVDTFALNISITQALNCGGFGNISALASGGTGPFEYTWTGSGSGIIPGLAIQSELSAGNYSVLVKDVGSQCERLAENLELLDGDGLAIQTIVSPPTSCGGTNGKVVAITNLPGAVYEWVSLPSLEVLGTDSVLNSITAGLYRIRVQKGTCADSADVEVEGGIPFSLSAQTDSASCSNNDGAISLTVTNNRPSIAFQWTKVGDPSFSAQGAALSNLSAGIYRVIATDGTCSDTLDVELFKISGCPVTCNLQALATSLPATCPGSSDGTAFSFIVSGGKGPFSYQLNGGPVQTLSQFLASFANQPAGPFTITIQDVATGCRDTISAQIGSRTSLLATVFPTNPNCQGTAGSIRVVVSGGTAPYTLVLNGQSIQSQSGDTTLSGLAAGLYALSIASAEGCQTTVPAIQLQGSGPIQISFADAKDVSCAGGSNGEIRIVPQSGSDGFTYFIPGKTGAFEPLNEGITITGLAAGTYPLFVRGNGFCPLDTQFVVAQPGAIVLAITKLQKSGCLDSTGSAKLGQLSGGKGQPWSFSLNRFGQLFRAGALPADSIFGQLPFGQYELVVRDSANCASSVAFEIETEKIPLNVQLTASSTQICRGQSVSLNVAAPSGIALTYAWYLNNKLLAASGSSLSIDTLKNADSIYVVVKGNARCLFPDSVRSASLHFGVSPANQEMLAQINALKPNACIGQAALLEAVNVNNLPMPSYRWIVNGIVLPTDTNSSLQLFPGLPVNNVQVIIRSLSNSNCIAKQSDTSEAVTVRQIGNVVARDTLKLQTSGNFICSNRPITFYVRSTIWRNLSAQIQWWKNDTLVATTTDSAFTFEGLPAGTQRIKAVVLFDSTLSCVSTNWSAGRDSTSSITIRVWPQGDVRCRPCSLNATATISNISCAGAATGSIIAQATGGSGGYVYSLLPSGPQNQTLPFFFGLSPGSYSLLVRDTITQCVSNLTGLNLGVLNSYTLSVSATNPSPCNLQADGKLEFVSISDGSADLNKYKFRIRDTDPFSLNRLYSGLPAGTYLMEVIDTLTGCISQLSRTLQAPPAIQAFGSIIQQPLCYGQFNGQLRLDSVKFGSGLYQYSLSGDSGTFSSISSGNPIPVGFGAGFRQVFIRDVQSGCLDTLGVVFIQPDSLRLRNTVLIESQCFAPTGQIKLNEFSGGTGALSLTYRFPGSNLFLPVSIPADSVLTNLIGGIYVFRISDQNGCVKEWISDVPINSPKANITIVRPCIGDSNGVIRISNMRGGTAPYLYQLSDDQGNQLASQSDTLFANLKPGLYAVKMSDASSPACETNYTVNVEQAEPLRFLLQVVKPSTCENFDGILKFGLRGGQAGYRYSFDSLPNQFTAFKPVLSDTLVLSGLSTRAPGELYTLRILDNGPSGGCPYDTTFQIPGNSPLRFRYSLRNVKCFGEKSGAILFDSLNGTGPVLIRVVNSESGEIVRTDSITGGFFLNNQFELGGIPAGSFTCLVTQYGACNASRTFAFALSQPSQISIEARMYKATAEGFALGSILLDTVRGSVAPYQVSFDGSSFFNYTPDTLFDRLNAGVYTILVKDAIGCEVEREIEVAEDRELFIPTLFTPNGDGKNDRFEIRNLPPNAELEVRNRWGKTILKESPYRNDWDGKDESEGTFFYILNIPGQAARNGWVEIKR